MQSITIHNQHGEDVTLPASRSHHNEASLPGAVRLMGQVDTNLPISASILLKEDGTWHHVNTEYGRSLSYYLHFDLDPDDEPTEAQRETIAEWFFTREGPYGMSMSAPLMTWAFAGISQAQLARSYGYETVPVA